MPSTNPQHMTALHRANEIRFARAVKKRAIKDAPKAQAYTLVAELVAGEDAELWASAKVVDLMLTPKHAQRQWALSVLFEAFCTEHKTFAELTERQRKVIGRALEEKIAHYERALMAVAA